MKNLKSFISKLSEDEKEELMGMLSAEMESEEGEEKPKMIKTKVPAYMED